MAGAVLFQAALCVRLASGSEKVTSKNRLTLELIPGSMMLLCSAPGRRNLKKKGVKS